MHAIGAAVRGSFGDYLLKKDDVERQSTQMAIRSEIQNYVHEDINYYLGFVDVDRIGTMTDVEALDAKLAKRKGISLITTLIVAGWLNVVHIIVVNWKTILLLVSVNKIKENEYWCGDEAIAAAAKLYERRIIVDIPFEAGHVFNSSQGGEPIVLSYINSNHYDLLERDTTFQGVHSVILNEHFNYYLKFKNYKRMIIPDGE